MALGRSIKMYLTIFVATTCMYMVLYQYHISRQPMPQPDIIKQHKDKSIARDSKHNGIGGSYTSYSSFLSSNNNNISSSATFSSSISSIPSTLSSNNNLNLKRKQSFNKTTLSSALTASSLFSLPKHTTKLFKKMNLFLWSPMSLLSSSSSSSTDAKRAISLKKSSLAFKKQNNNSNMASKSLSSSSSRAMDLNNTLITSSSTTLSSSTTTTTTTTTTNNTTSKTSVTSTISTSSLSTVSAASSASASASASRLTKTIKTSSSILSQKQHPKQNSDKQSSLQQQQSKVKQQRPQQEQEQEEQAKETVTDKPPLYIITPTYRRPEQLAELTRLGYTLKHVNNLLWLVIEDANKTSASVIQILNRIGVPYEYFLAPMPEVYKKSKGAKPRGVSNRNRGLKWLRENATEGVFYFADDDNTYDISIFEQMRYTKKVSMWPVGLVTKFGVSSPIVKQGKLTGFYDGWIGGRKYPIDMAGFAVSVKFLHERPNAKMPFKTGYEEDGFLKTLAPLNNSEIELLANNCTQILTWHTQTKKNSPAETVNATKYVDTNIILLDKMLVRH